MSKVTVKQAAQLTGKTKETINKATNEGKLSVSQNSSGFKVIEIAELERIYPLVKTMDDLNQKPKAVSTSQPASDSDTNSELAALREKLASSERTIELLNIERKREREQLESQIENLRTSLEKSQDQHNKALLLITDQSQRSTDRIEEQKEIKSKASRTITRLRQELEAEKSKSIFQKLFG